MGGHALESIGIQTRRQSRPEIDIIYKEIGEIFSPLCSRFQESIYYRRKDSFGDLDILISTDVRAELFTVHEKVRELVKSGQSKGYSVNSTVISFEWRDLQVDLIWFPIENFPTAVFYYSYNDLHNLIGKIADWVGLTFGEWGLKTRKITEGEKVFNFVLEKDPRKIYEALGYDYDKYLAGFDSIDEIFNFVLTSPRFDYRAFLPENMDYRNRTRNKKRPLYQQFLKFLEDFPKIESSIPKYTLDDIFEKWKDTGVKLAYLEFHRDILNDKIVRDKFSGYRIQTLTGLPMGKAIGEIIVSFKTHMVQHTPYFQRWVIETPISEIEEKFLSWYKTLT